MPKVVDHEVYRVELLERAVGAFAEHGYASLSMKQLADRLGISHGLFYHYFESKEPVAAFGAGLCTADGEPQRREWPGAYPADDQGAAAREPGLVTAAGAVLIYLFAGGVAGADD